MQNVPQPFWAVILAVLGVITTIVVYIHPGDVTTRQAAFQIASSLVTGALGAFAGHASATTKKTPDPNTPSS
jgi:hypothetical protein